MEEKIMEGKKQKRMAAREVFQQQVMQNMLEMPAEEVNMNIQQQAQPMAQNAYANKSPKQEIKLPEQKTSEELQQEKGGLQVRETGWWCWRTIVVPPNAYVVHTRRGCEKPITIGLGKSFRYNPRTDSYLVVPAAMQTIGIVAQGISKEKQGISILAYVQWLISDFSLAYQRLDFSDSKDPMGIVNAQLREQAEAAIKDKIATMSVDEVLTDKAPIIEELTQRMKAVAESKQGDRLSGMGGLGLQIVTVQIKEAFVCSQRLWELLQAPFRNEAEREARLSRLRIEEEVRQQELTNSKRIQTGESQTQAEIEKFKAEKESESLEVVSREKMRRDELSAKAEQQKVTLEEENKIRQQLSQKKIKESELRSNQEIKLIQMQQDQTLMSEKSRLESERQLKEKEIAFQSKIKELEAEEKLKEKELEANMKKLEDQKSLKEKEHEMAIQSLNEKLALQKLEEEYEFSRDERLFQAFKSQEEQMNSLKNSQIEQELTQKKIQQDIYNSISDKDIARRFVEGLPELAKQMPDIKELKTLQISSDGTKGDCFSTLTSYLVRLLELSKNLGIKLPGTAETYVAGDSEKH